MGAAVVITGENGDADERWVRHSHLQLERKDLKIRLGLPNVVTKPPSLRKQTIRKRTSNAKGPGGKREGP